MRLIFTLICIALSLSSVATSRAAEIVLYPSAVDAGLKRELFTQNGKFVLAGDPRTCAFTTLATPTTSFRDGRLFVRAYLASATAILVNNQCVGGGDAFWVTVSAEPFVARDILGLRGARVEDAPPLYRPLVEIFLRTFSPQALNINLRGELAKLLQDNRTTYQVTVPASDVLSITARDNALAVTFDFRLEAR